MHSCTTVQQSIHNVQERVHALHMLVVYPSLSPSLPLNHPLVHSSLPPYALSSRERTLLSTLYTREFMHSMRYLSLPPLPPPPPPPPPPSLPLHHPLVHSSLPPYALSSRERTLLSTLYTREFMHSMRYLSLPPLHSPPPPPPSLPLHHPLVLSSSPFSPPSLPPRAPSFSAWSGRWEPLVTKLATTGLTRFFASS